MRLRPMIVCIHKNINTYTNLKCNVIKPNCVGLNVQVCLPLFNIFYANKFEFKYEDLINTCD